MKHLVVFSHPNPKSFCKAIVETIVKISDAKGFTIKIKDLYADNFDPLLSAADFAAFIAFNE